MCGRQMVSRLNQILKDNDGMIDRVKGDIHVKETE